MASRYEIEATISSAKDLKNVNWRHGSLRPYAVVWVDPSSKCSTKVDEESDTCPLWDQSLVIPLPAGSIQDHTLRIDIVHAGSEEDTKPLIGSARLNLGDVLDEVGLGESLKRTLQLKRPSGRPQGKVTVKVTVREPRYRAPDAYYASPYGVPPPSSTRDYYGTGPYAAPPPNPYYYSAPQSGYPYSSQPQPPQPYGQASYGHGYGEQPVYVQEEKKKSKFGGMGTGLAVGAVAGVLGGLALAEGVEAVEDNIAEKAAEKVEDDLGYGGDDFDGGDDF